MSQDRLSPEELAAESATALPTKEVVSLLDLNADVDLGLDLAAPVDLAVAANLNVAAPIDAAASANVLSAGSDAAGLAQQQVLIDQHLDGAATATAPQDASVDQADPAPYPDATTADPAAGSTSLPSTGLPGTSVPTPDLPSAGSVVGDPLSGDLLDVNVDINANADIAAPIAGAVAANGNIAAPIDAAVSANIGSIDSSATAVADQTAVINQDIDGATADATADQSAEVTQ